MRRWLLRLGVFAMFGIGAAIGCSAAKGNAVANGAGGAGGGGGSSGTSTSSSGFGGFGVGGGSGGSGGAASCAQFTAEAKQAPAALLFVLDMSASMTTNMKWGTSQLAVVQAIDNDVFDTMSLGLVTFPSSFANPPPCLCQGLDPATCASILAPGVSCGVSVLPQVPLAAAGMNKSNASSGPRHDLYQYLANHNPLSNADDGAPIYDALAAGYNALKSYSIDKRLVVLVTDGGFSCTSLSSPTRPGYTDLNGCDDWEYPDTVNKLIDGARTDAAKPINTFVVGVPGSNSHGEKQGSFDTAPYSMLLALSTYAVSGSPDTVDPACDKAATFTKAGTDPAKPCHIDLSSNNFNADALAKAIGSIRGKALGCTYDLPAPPMGQQIDTTKVNVEVTIAGVTTSLKKRSNPADTCDVDGCWDYDANGKVVLLGKSCADVSAALDAKVDIIVGCSTIVK